MATPGGFGRRWVYPGESDGMVRKVRPRLGESGNRGAEAAGVGDVCPHGKNPGQGSPRCPETASRGGHGRPLRRTGGLLRMIRSRQPLAIGDLVRVLLQLQEHGRQGLSEGGGTQINNPSGQTRSTKNRARSTSS
jgi:hypothetical protein